MAKFTPRRKTSRAPRQVRKGGDLQKLHIKVSSPRIVMFQVLRGMGKGVRYAMLLALLGLIGIGGYKGVTHLFLGNEKYTLKHIDPHTNGKIDVDRIVEVTGIDRDANIFAIDTSDMRDVLLDLPEVIDCEVERHLPDTLRIKITERVPAVWIECAALGYPGRRTGGVLVDKMGITFPCEGALWDAARDLPVIVVKQAKSDAFQHGSKMKHPEVIRALNLVKTFSTGKVRAQWLPERIVLINDYSMEAVCNDGSRAIFGMYDHQRQLSDFITIREKTYETRREVQRINLIPSKNIPVIFAGAPVLVKPHRRPNPVNPHEREIQSILDRN